MTDRLQALDNKSVGTDSFGLTNYDKLQADIEYEFRPGADVTALTAGNTVPIDHRHHKVTVATGNIDSISDAGGDTFVAGQVIELQFSNAQTVRNNGGGTGSIRTVDGADHATAANETVRFIYDGSHFWAQFPTPSAPWLVDIDVFATAVSHVNWDGNDVNANAIHNAVKENSSSLNDEINFDVVLSAGTWTIELMYPTEPDGGIVTVSLSSDGGSTFTAVGSAPYSGSGSTIDTYAGAGAWNTRTALTGITIGGSQRYRLKLKMTSKNASSSGYKLWLQHVQLRRTA